MKQRLVTEHIPLELLKLYKIIPETNAGNRRKKLSCFFGPTSRYRRRWWLGGEGTPTRAVAVEHVKSIN